ncbi:uncharacterized protein LOC135624199 [Musa acuminata AAA Group]|uniref:uncharacterized protein LOC103969377 n=1 Tax=Musa acuminata AAA Group TaxID=214697 RepID=UPI0031E2BCC3
MEAITDQSVRPALVAGSSKLRYPLRSEARLKDGKPMIAEPVSSSASKRGRSSPAVSKSVSVLDLSGKEKCRKPSRRLSIPIKPAASPCPTIVGSITPISETRAKRSNVQANSDTPLLEVSKSISRRKFNVLSSVSYWLTQIKLSESSSRHSISLGFFKLALESGCEPIDRMREELISYIQRHSLVAEKEDSVKDLLQRYNIVEDTEKLKLSETSSKLPEEVTLRPDQERHGISSTSRIGNLTPKLLNVSTPVVVNSNRNDGIQKRLPSYTRRGLYNKIEANIAADKDDKSTSTQKKSQKPRTKPINGNEKIKRSLNNSPTEPGDKADILPTEEASLSHEDKENMDVHVSAEANSLEEIQVN